MYDEIDVPIAATPSPGETRRMAVNPSPRGLGNQRVLQLGRSPTGPRCDGVRPTTGGFLAERHKALCYRPQNTLTRPGRLLHHWVEPSIRDPFLTPRLTDGYGRAGQKPDSV